LHHTHIQFGHCYKRQDNWDQYLSRFARGNGLLYDIEFLTDASGQRVSAFGYWAGYAGTAIALLAWSNQVRNLGQLPSSTGYQTQSDLITDLKAAMSDALSINKVLPRVLVTGALGRCGTRAIDACLNAGVPDGHVIKWVGDGRTNNRLQKLTIKDMAETAQGGPFDEIV
jgi:saccharopine dehydrogenase (NAD+, L-lysine forming)